MRIVRLLIPLWCALCIIQVNYARQDAAVTPAETVRLFNGRDLSNFYSWLVDHKFNDPNHVFSVVDQIDAAPAIRISGQDWGGLITKQRYANYRLIVEFRWGLLTWASRKDKSKDSGVLVHCQGPDGNYRPDFNGPWMRSIEFQIIQGGVGDIILVAGYEKDGQRIVPTLASTVRPGRGSEIVYDPAGTLRELSGGRINWYGRDPDWSDKLGFRGREDVESPEGQWTRLEAICDGSTITQIVNGKVVNKGTKSSLAEGKILLQSEGAEIYFRRVDLEPLGKR